VPVGGKEYSGSIVIMCTNLRGASVSTKLSDELEIPIIDSVAVAFQHALHRLGL